MARESIDLTIPAVVPHRQPDPSIPTIQFSEKTKQSFIGFVGHEVLPQVVETLNNFLSTKARSDIQAKIQEKSRENWSKYAQDILAGKDINSIIDISESNIKEFFHNQSGLSLHHNYW